jgi:gliding motility-associated-like protein
VCAQTITRVEYYFDTDPGFGNGTSIPVTAAADLTRDFSVPLNSVSEGIHILYFRAKSSTGLWSIPWGRTVYVQRNSQTASLYSIDRIEYFFDTDPGFGNGISIPITTASDLTENFQLPFTSLPEGFHTIYYRAKSSNGLWSTLLAKPVFIQRNAQTAATPNLRKIEYFLDTDPGAGNATSISLSASAIDQSYSIDLSTAPLGFHILYVRSQDTNGRWSLPMAKPFFVNKSGSNIVALEYYYFDGTTKSPIKIYSGFPPGQNVTIDFATVLDGLLPNTSYEIHVTAINGDGLRSVETVHTFLTPAVICDPLTPPAIVNATLCGSGSVDLDASGATGTQSYAWYQTPVGGVALVGEADGIYTTPVLSNTTTYYVAIKNGTCESTRTQVTAFINPIPTAPLTINNETCGVNSAVTLTATGGSNGEYRWYEVAAGGTALPGEINDSYITPTLIATTTYYVSIDNGSCESARTAVTATINTISAAPSTTNNTACVINSTVTLTATGGSIGEYRWYEVATGGNALSGEVNDTYITPPLSATTTYYVSLNSGICESSRSAVTAFINPIPAPPVATNNGTCGINSTVTLTATGGSNGEYRWYDVGVGGTALLGEVNDTFITPPLSATTTYYVALDNSGCESARTAATASINPNPPQPSVTSNIPFIGNALTICANTDLTLNAPSGFAGYLWSNGGTTQQIDVSSNGTYSVVVTNLAGCSSTESDAIYITIIPLPCNNQAPVINTSPLSTIIGGNVSLNLLDLISDADDNLAISSLVVLQPPASGASAIITNGVLTINYSDIAFTGKDQLTIQVCDIFNECTQQVFEIDVIGDIEIYNGLSPNNDGKNDIFLIQYIDLLPDTQENKVTIYNRWGSKVFEVEKYNNTTKVFRGLNTSENELPSGTYFYKIEFENRDTITGYLTLKR